jgi:O-antigen/teichoic acid export membrane protein
MSPFTRLKASSLQRTGGVQFSSLCPLQQRRFKGNSLGRFRFFIVIPDARIEAEQVEKGGRTLRSRVLRAGSWALFGHFLTLALRFIGNLILTRIFAPEIFGILAVVSSVLTVISLLADMGLRQAVIQSANGKNSAFLNTAWTLQILRGFLIWSFGAIFAVVIYVAGNRDLLPAGSVYTSPGLPAYIVVASFSAVLWGFQSMKAVTADRNLDLKRVIAIELLVQIVSLLLVVWLGWATRSIWSYIAGGLFSAAIAAALSHIWLSGPMDRFAWNKTALQELARFGKWTFVSSAIAAFAMNGDSLLLGGWVGAAVLGYYSIASNLASLTEGVAGRIYGSVSLPALSEIARLQPHRFPELHFRLRWVTDAVLLSIAGFLFATGAEIIKLLYDPRYSSAGWILQWLSFSLLFTRYGVVHSAYLALGRPEYNTAINITKVISLFTIVPLLFYTFGLPGAVIGIAFHMCPTVLWIFYFNGRHGLNNFRFEIFILGMWPLGWLTGSAFIVLVETIKLSLFGSH